jgi:hypothetical protein
LLFLFKSYNKTKSEWILFFLNGEYRKSVHQFLFSSIFLSPFETSHSFFNKQKGFTILVPEKFMFKTQKSADRVRSLTTILPIYKFIILFYSLLSTISWPRFIYIFCEISQKMILFVVYKWCVILIWNYSQLRYV